MTDSICNHTHLSEVTDSRTDSTQTISTNDNISRLQLNSIVQIITNIGAVLSCNNDGSVIKIKVKANCPS